jgi:outer membrane protein OmpA-like peptidoglycan-associated protein
VRGITRLLVGTGALPANPLQGRESWLFHDAILRGLSESGFHPGRELRGNADNLASADPIRATTVLPALSDAQWAQLVPIGKLRHEPIAFGRGNARLNVSSLRSLEELAQKLETWPYSYLVVVGHARQEGDAEANRALALERAGAAAGELQRLGVPGDRLRPTTRLEGRFEGGDAQAVSFELVQPAY